MSVRQDRVLNKLIDLPGDVYWCNCARKLTNWSIKGSSIGRSLKNPINWVVLYPIPVISMYWDWYQDATMCWISFNTQHCNAADTFIVSHFPAQPTPPHQQLIIITTSLPTLTQSRNDRITNPLLPTLPKSQIPCPNCFFPAFTSLKHCSEASGPLGCYTINDTEPDYQSTKVLTGSTSRKY